MASDNFFFKNNIYTKYIINFYMTERDIKTEGEIDENASCFFLKKKTKCR
jgi:hypothetical protein